MSTTEHKSSVSRVAWDLLANSAPRRRMRDVLTIGTRLRRRRDGALVRVRQVHRAERRCEAQVIRTRPWPRIGPVFVVTFEEIAADFDLLVPLVNVR